ncbi:sensor histidine kinase [Actinocorallia libanotica]|uniref:histidine kinase n=1 Tax=Actinocorallia libanotica TaxID=46162 RepID=A0ABN1QJW7_9ACTN
MPPVEPREPWYRRSRPAVTELLAWCGGMLYPPVLFLTVARGRQGFDPVLVVPAALLTLLAVSLVRRGPLPAVALLAVAWTGAVLAMPKLEIAFLAVAITDGTLAYLAATRPRRVSLPALTVLLAAQTACAHLTAPIPAMPSTLGLLALAAAVAWMAGNSARQRRLHAAQLAEQAAAQAVTAERLRIARELHDMVAHSIGVIAIQAGVGGRVIDTQPAEARNALGVIEATSRETLSGLRRMLGALRRAEPGDTQAPRGPAPGLADLEGLIRTTGDAGVRVETSLRGEHRPLPAEVDLAAFRIVQESLTNVVRHANTDRCRVSIDYADEELVVEVVDDGHGPSGGGAGYGLTGMRERVALLSGGLTTGPRPEGGFRVEARLPIPARTGAAAADRRETQDAEVEGGTR